MQLNQSGRIYVTEDLYGMDRNPTSNPFQDPQPTNGEGNEGDDGGGQLIDNDSSECVICMTDPKEVAVYPCRHMCMCLTCAEALPSQNNKCPMCRRPALLLLRLPYAHRSLPLLTSHRLKVWSDEPPNAADQMTSNGVEAGERIISSRSASPKPATAL